MVFLLAFALELLAAAVGMLLDKGIGLGLKDAAIGVGVMQGPMAAGLLLAGARIERVDWGYADQFARLMLFGWGVGTASAVGKAYSFIVGFLTFTGLLLVGGLVAEIVNRRAARKPTVLPSSYGLAEPALRPAGPLSNAQAQESILHSQCGECGHIGFDLETYSVSGWYLGRCFSCGHRREFTFPTW